MFNKMKLLKIFIILFFPKISFASVDALPYLRAGVGAKAVGLGNAYTSIIDVNAIYWNPASLANLNKFEFTTMYGVLSVERQLNFFASVLPFDFGSFGLGVIQAGVRNIEEWIDDGTTFGFKKGNFNYQSFTCIVSYGGFIAENFSFGGNIKFISDKLKDQTNPGYGVDFGFHSKLAIEKLDSPINFGLTFQDIYSVVNLKSGEKDIIPLNIRLGFSLKFLDKVLFAFDLNKVSYREKFGFNSGVEIDLSDNFQIRAGLDKKFSNVALPSIGFSINLWMIKFDYGFQVDSFKEGDKHFLSVGMRF